MNVLLLVILTGLGYLAAYHTYGRFLAKKIFTLDSSRITPAKALADGKDFVPSKKAILFGHHFTSIAGTGPIVGPAIGVIWGWVPALIWIVFGSIFMGAVHDFGALYLSLRHDGKSISEITAAYINKRVRLVFFIIVFLALLIVLAIFGLVIAIIFARFPSSVIPIWFQIPLAVILGKYVFQKNKSLPFYTVIFVGFMYLSIWLGSLYPITLSTFLGIPPTGLWTIILLLYALIASILPVSTLLQPRDYMNAWQLYFAMGAIILGILVSGLSGDLILSAPAFNMHPEGAPAIWPFLFITIACGAISGFHCLVSSGTSSKQLASEDDAQLVGYGSMLLEGGLAVLVLIAVTAGIGLAYDANGTVLTGLSAWTQHYGSWSASSGLGSKLDAVVIGFSNMMTYIGIPLELGVTIIGVFIASFAGTTLDSSARVQRYIVSELFSNTSFSGLSNKYIAAFIAVFTGGVLAFSSGADGAGALALWPLFGSVNQLLAALALMVTSMFLRRRGGYGYLVSWIPFVFMIVMTIWAVAVNQYTFFDSGNGLLVMINGVTLGLSLYMIIETMLLFFKGSNEG